MNLDYLVPEIKNCPRILCQKDIGAILKQLSLANPETIWSSRHIIIIMGCKTLNEMEIWVKPGAEGREVDRGWIDRDKLVGLAFVVKGKLYHMVE